MKDVRILLAYRGKCTDLLVVDGRFCAQIKPGLTCCLPCPASDYLYPQSFKSWYRAAEALNLVGLACMVFLLLTFLCLPAEKTRRHYLSYGLIIGAVFLSVRRSLPALRFLTHHWIARVRGSVRKSA
jgi:hypothetical protein